MSVQIKNFEKNPDKVGKIKIKTYRFRGLARFSGPGFVDGPDPELVGLSGFDRFCDARLRIGGLRQAASNPRRAVPFLALDHVPGDGGSAVRLRGLPLQVDPVLIPIDNFDVARGAGFICGIYFYV